ncbi:fibronectin type III domain-containing protein [Parafilimonas sp.]|uniref:fibronectin type III domain-containing protein n=1 Tax=Parafilimonas sp. TaxID=1969739 RepID=UPI003F7E0872
MKQNFTLVFLLLVLFLAGFHKNVKAQSVLNPNDPVINYDPQNPPAEPPYGQIGKWVRTKNVSWNSDSYKAYIYEGSCFRLKFPKTYNPTVNDGKKYPMAIVFHGGGESGPITDNESQLYHGGKPYMDAVDNGTFDGYVLFMQSQGFWGVTSYQRVIDIIDYMVQYNKLDPFCMSVNGLSSGGQASWDMILNYPDYIGASLPMSSVSIGYKEPSVVNKLKFTPIWNFQGELDGSPSPSTAQQVRDAMLAAGANYRYSEYANTAHSTWDRAFAEPDFFPFILRGYSSNPWVLYGRTGFCTGDAINVTIGVATGFDKYEWRKNGNLIAGATGNTITATSFGIYEARVLRGTLWSDWSRIPVNIHVTPPTKAPPIKVSGLMSPVIVSGDGKNYVNLEIPGSGYTSYAWKKAGNSTVLGTERIFKATEPGNYTVSVTEEYSCSSIPSDPFLVVNAAGQNAPPPATNLVANANSGTEVLLTWLDNPHPSYNETAFEIYRSQSATGGYNYIGKAPSDSLEYRDATASPGLNYYYKVRAINNSGAAAMSNIANTITTVDNIAPTAPANLQIVYTTNSSIKISWSSSTDNIGVTGYQVFLNGEKSYVSTDTSFLISGLKTGQRYTIYVKAADSSGNVSPQSEIKSAAAVLNGLVYKYYEGYWKNVPDFNTLTPLETGITPNVNLKPARRQPQLAFLWQGYINIPVDGTYTFTTNSDDGSKFWLNEYDPGIMPFINNDDGVRKSAKSKSNSIILKKGLYPISLGYFQNKGPRTMQLAWSCKELFGNTTTRIIANMYFKSDYVPEGTAPKKPLNLQATATSFDKINLTWTDNSNNETGFQVYRKVVNGTEEIIHTTAAGVSAFTDSGLNPRTKYIYRVNAVNEFGNSAKTPLVNATTTAMPAIKTPTLFKATTLSSSSVKLTWKDNNTTETGYQVFRSVSDSLHFKPAAILPENSSTYTDSNLYGNMVYYYKVKAINSLAVSPATAAIKGTTLNNRPVIDNSFLNSQQLTVKAGAQTIVQIHASDADGDQLTFSSSNIPSFTGFTDNGNGTATFAFNPLSTNTGTYNGLKIRVTDTHGGKDSLVFTLVVNTNTNPVMDSIADYTVSEGGHLNIVLDAADPNSGQTLQWSVKGLPAGYSISPIDTRSAALIINPGYDASGIYNAEVTVNDGAGGIVKRSFILTVSDYDPNLEVYIRFKDQNDMGAPWNNITSVNTPALKDNFGRTTGIGLNMQTSWWSVWHEGPSTGNNSGIYPDNVLKDYYYFGVFGGPETVTSQITGLDTSRKYSISFYAGSVWIGASDNGTTVYTIGSQSKSLYVQGNTTNTADFKDIKPTANGTITFTMSKGANTPVGYLNAITIKSFYTDSTRPVKPASLQASYIAGQGVQLTWNDAAYNETKYQVYRSFGSGGGFTLIADNLAINTKSYTDNSVSGNTGYFYFVQAVNNAGASIPSDTASIVTANKVPAITPIANVSIKNNQQKNIDIVATDDSSDNIVLSVDNLPSFATFTDNGNGTGRIAVNPTNGVTGRFDDVTVTATDNHNASGAVSFSITVTDQNIQSVYINFSNGSAAPSPWNNFTAWPSANAGISGLKDDANNTTGISLKLLNGFQGNIAGGMQPGNDYNLYPQEVVRTGEYEGSSKIDSMKISGLDQTKKYNFIFFNSHDDGLNGNTRFEINGQAVTLDAAYNINKTVQINGITPNSAGEVTIKISKAAGADYAYINSLVIQSYSSSLQLLAPADLFVKEVTKNMVKLQWADRSFDETGFEIWRATDSNAVYTLQKTVAANVTAFTDSNLLSAKTYYYSVRAVKPGAQSGFCNTVAAATYAQVIYVNFTFQNQANVPWNNTLALPEDGLVWNNLLDDSGIPSSISLQQTGIFAGIYAPGMNTGNNSGVFPDKVLADSYGLFTGQSATMKVTGLNVNLTYDFTFFASSQAGGDVNSSYMVNGKKAVLNASLNTKGTITVYNVQPDENGEAVITIAPNTLTSQFGLLGALLIKEHEASGNAPSTEHTSASATPIAAINKTAGTSSLQAADIITGNKVAAYPNPFVNDFTVDLSLTKPDNIRLELYAINGLLILNKNIGNLPEGKHSFKIKPDASIKPGTYILKILYRDANAASYFKLLKQ